MTACPLASDVQGCACGSSKCDSFRTSGGTAGLSTCGLDVTYQRGGRLFTTVIEPVDSILVLDKGVAGRMIGLAAVSPFSPGPTFHVYHTRRRCREERQRHVHVWRRNTAIPVVFRVVGRKEKPGLHRGPGWRHTPFAELWRSDTQIDLDGESYVLPGDLDLDGDMDIVTGYTQVLLNDGRGDWTSAGWVNRRGSTREVSLQDVDNDGDLDLVAVRSGGRGVVLYLNDTIVSQAGD